MTTPGWYDDGQDVSRWRWWDGQQWTEHYAPKTTTASPAQAFPRQISTVPLKLAVTFRLPASQWAKDRLQPGFLTLAPVSQKVCVLDADGNMVVSMDACNALFGWAGYQFRIMDKTAPNAPIVQIDFAQNEKPPVGGVSRFGNELFVYWQLESQRLQEGYWEFVDTLEHLGGKWSRDVYKTHARFQIGVLAVVLTLILLVPGLAFALLGQDGRAIGGVFAILMIIPLYGLRTAILPVLNAFERGRKRPV